MPAPRAGPPPATVGPVTWPVASGSLLLGFAVARTAALVAVYAGAFVVSHVIADTLGAWPSVLLAAALTGLAAYVLADSAGRGVSPARARP